MFKATALTAHLMTLPPAQELEQLIEEYPGFRRTDLADSDFLVRAFTRNVISGRYITPLQNGFMLDTVAFRRIVPTKALEREVKAAIEKAEEDAGCELDGDEVGIIREQVRLVLAPQMLTDEKCSRLIYHADSGLLLICASAAEEVRDATQTLYSLFKTYKSHRLTCKGQKEKLTSCLSEHIDADTIDDPASAFGEHFGLNDYVVLKEKSTKGQKGGQLTLKDMHIPRGHDSHGILQSVQCSDAKIEKIGLRYLDQFTFTLSPGLVLTSIAPVISNEELIEAESDDQSPDQDPVEQFIDEASALLELYADCYKKLADLVGYELPSRPDLAVLKANDAPEEPQESGEEDQEVA